MEAIHKPAPALPIGFDATRHGAVAYSGIRSNADGSAKLYKE
jgi:hypothetical protein